MIENNRRYRMRCYFGSTWEESLLDIEHVVVDSVGMEFEGILTDQLLKGAVEGRIWNDSVRIAFSITREDDEHMWCEGYLEGRRCVGTYRITDAKTQLSVTGTFEMWESD